MKQNMLGVLFLLLPLLPAAEISPAVYLPSSEWRKAELDALEVMAGSALDLSRDIEVPAGKFGRAVARPDGTLAFENDPSRRVRFMGFSGGIPKKLWSDPDEAYFRREITRIARAARRQGYNLFRANGFDEWVMHGSEEAGRWKPQALDRWDWVVSEFKKEGIYTHLVLFSYALYEPERKIPETFRDRVLHKVNFLLGNPYERDRFRHAVRGLMEHVNPHTGTAWKDEPAIHLVEFYNEAYFGFSRIETVARQNPEEFKQIAAVWNAFLGRKYLGRPAEEQPPELAEYGPGRVPFILPGRKYSEKLHGDYVRFRLECVRETMRFCVRTLREAGCRALLTDNTDLAIFNGAAHWETLGYIDSHTYYAHPGKWDAPGSRVEQGSSAAGAFVCMRNLASKRLYGRPYGIGEYNHCFWNPYQYEMPVAFAAYAAFQDFCALTVHTLAVEPDSRRDKSVSNFHVARNPVLRAGEFLGHMLFLRGDVTPSRRRTVVAIPDGYLYAGRNGERGISSEQSKLALLTNFSILFPDRPAAAGVFPPDDPDLLMPVSGGSGVFSQGWYTGMVEERDERFSLSGCVDQMKKAGILPPDNRSDPAGGIFQTDTGEITLHAKENFAKVVTPRTEAVALTAEKGAELGVLRLNRTSVDALAGLTSVDALPLAESRRMVLVFSTRVMNAGMRFRADDPAVLEAKATPGQPSFAMLRTGQAEFEIRTPCPGTMRCYALGMDGSRKESVPCIAGNGKLVIRLDTAALRFGPTPFFELIGDAERE